MASPVRFCRPLIVLGVLAALAALLLDARPLAAPGMVLDDFEIVAQSWTWPKTWAGLWRPQNEHAMPLGRLLTFGLVRLAGRPTALPRACSLAGPLALLASLPLLYTFVRRETGQAGVALAAVILFGVSSVYGQAVFWFAASFALWSVDTLLLALLACQRWRQTGRPLALAATLLLAALCPAWFALGVLAGPLCTLYLLAPRRELAGIRSRAAQVVAALAPLAGTALFLAVSLPRTLDHINHLPHHEGQSILEVLYPLGGLAYSARAVIDGLALGVLGVTGVALPVPVVVLALPALAALGLWWGRRARAPALQWLGLGMVVAGYLLVYSARTRWGYEILTQPSYSRYHLLPHLGLVLFVCGGLPGRWCFREQADGLRGPQVRVLAWLLAACLVLQLPRGLFCSHAGMPTGTTLRRLKEDSRVAAILLAPLTEEQLLGLDRVAAQQAALRHIEEVDALCRRHQISAAAARDALPPLEIPDSYAVINGWDLLRGSDSPQERPAEEVRRLLESTRANEENARVWPKPGTGGSPEGSTSRPGARRAHGAAGTRVIMRPAGSRWAGSCQAAGRMMTRVPIADLKQPSPRGSTSHTPGRRSIALVQSTEARLGPTRRQGNGARGGPGPSHTLWAGALSSSVTDYPGHLSPGDSACKCPG